MCFKWNVNAHTQGIPEVVCEPPPKGWRGSSNAHLEFSLETHAQLTKMKAYLRNIELAPKQLASWFILICWVVGPRIAKPLCCGGGRGGGNQITFKTREDFQSPAMAKGAGWRLGLLQLTSYDSQAIWFETGFREKVFILLLKSNMRAEVCLRSKALSHAEHICMISTQKPHSAARHCSLLLIIMF